MRINIKEGISFEGMIHLNNLKSNAIRMLSDYSYKCLFK